MFFSPHTDEAEQRTKVQNLFIKPHLHKTDVAGSAGQAKENVKIKDMQKQIQQLIEWHTKFDVPYKTTPDPFNDSDEETKIIRLRGRVMKEEVQEWLESALYNDDIEKRAKELADILYTVFGTVITEGLQDVIEQVFDAVHESNMSKLDENGKPVKRADGKVLKGSKYKEPDLSFLAELKEQ